MCAGTGRSSRVGRVSLTYAEALSRAARISDVTYRIDLDLTSRESFGCRTTVTFDLVDPRATTFLELADAADLRLTVNGAPVESPAYDGTRITLHDLAPSNEVVVEARVPYVNDGDGMHTVTDPADDATYVAAYAGMDLAHRVFACFDQPDLKAPITLTVRAPDDWTVVANGRLLDERRHVALHDHAADLDVPLHRMRRPLALAHLGARRPAVRLARAGVAGRRARPRLRQHARGHRALLRLLHADLRRAVPVRLLRPGDGPRPQLGRHGDGRLCHLPRRVPPSQRARRRRAGRPRDRDRARDGAHVVRRPGDHEVVAGHLAQRVVRGLHGLPRGPRGGRARLLARLLAQPQAHRVHRGRPPLDPPDRRGRRTPGRRRHGVHQLRHDHLRQGRLGAPPARDLAGLGHVREGHQRLPQPPPVRQRRARRLPRGARLGDRPRRARLGRVLPAHHRLRHDPGDARRRRTGAGARGLTAPPLQRGGPAGLRRHRHAAGRPRVRAGAAAGVRRPGRDPQRRRRGVRRRPARRPVVAGGRRRAVRPARPAAPGGHLDERVDPRALRAVAGG